MNRVLVTGGAGFIGSHVAAALVRRGDQVTVLDDLSGGFAENIPPTATFVQGSITDPALVDRVFEAGFDCVYHLAAYAAEGLSHFIRRHNYTNNVIGSVNLINAAINADVRRFVFTSSIAVYGSSPALPMTEETRPEPEDPYGVAKHAVEQDLRVCHDMFGLDYLIFRPHNVYGPGQNVGDRYRNVVGIFMNQILQDQPMTIFGDGTQTRAFSYIDDVAPVMAEALDRPSVWNQVFNIGADQPTTLNALALGVARAMGITPRVEHLPPRSEVQHAYSSHVALHRAFGEQAQTPLDVGLAAMARWVKGHGARTSAPFGAIEVTRKLPQVWRDR